MTKVMCFGTFDVVHRGHLKYFEQAKQHGDFLIVVVARDSTVEKEKKEKPMNSEEVRLKQVQEQELVDKAVLGNEGDKLVIVQQEKPDILCLGYDQHVREHELEEQLDNRGLHPRIVRAQAYKPETFKSSIIKAKIRKK